MPVKDLQDALNDELRSLDNDPSLATKENVVVAGTSKSKPGANIGRPPGKKKPPIPDGDKINSKVFGINYRSRVGPEEKKLIMKVLAGNLELGEYDPTIAHVFDMWERGKAGVNCQAKCPPEWEEMILRIATMVPAYEGKKSYAIRDWIFHGIMKFLVNGIIMSPTEISRMQLATMLAQAEKEEKREKELKAVWKAYLKVGARDHLEEFLEEQRGLAEETAEPWRGKLLTILDGYATNPIFTDENWEPEEPDEDGEGEG